MTLPNDQLLKELKEAGHTEAATALEQKLNAEAAVGTQQAQEGEQRLPDDQLSGPNRMAQAYGDRDAAAENAGGGGEGK